MTELRLGISASPEDVFGGRKGEFFRELTKTGRLFRVADNIEEVRPHVESRGLLLTEIYKDSWVVWREGQSLDKSELSLFTDKFDGFVWVVDSEVEKFEELFEVEGEWDERTGR